MLLKYLVIICLIPLVPGQFEQLDMQCHILQTLDDLQTKIDQQSYQIVTLTTSLTNADTRIIQQTTKITSFQNALAKAETEIARLKTSLAAAEIEIAILQNFSTSADTEIDNLKTTLTESPTKSKVTFHVRNVDGELIENATIHFLHVIANKDDVYDMATGCFTAPRAGTYWFSAQICAFESKPISPSIYIRGIVIGRTSLHNEDHASCRTVIVVSVLEEGDDVCLKSGPKQDKVPPIVWTDNIYQFCNFMGTIIN